MNLLHIPHELYARLTHMRVLSVKGFHPCYLPPNFAAKIQRAPKKGEKRGCRRQRSGSHPTLYRGWRLLASPFFQFRYRLCARPFPVSSFYFVMMLLVRRRMRSVVVRDTEHGKGEIILIKFGVTFIDDASSVSL